MMRHKLATTLAASTLALGACADTATSEDPASIQGGINNNTPGFLSHAHDLGPVDPTSVIEVTAWLKLHNEAQLDQLVAGQQQKGNANFHKWIDQAQFDAQFGPTTQELNSVQNW